MQTGKLDLLGGDKMKKLELSFYDTDETVILDENSIIMAIDHVTASDGFTKCFLLEVDEDLPNLLSKRPFMFYIYDDLPILKLYRSAYLSSYQWKD